MPPLLIVRLELQRVLDAPTYVKIAQHNDWYQLLTYVLSHSLPKNALVTCVMVGHFTSPRNYASSGCFFLHLQCRSRTCVMDVLSSRCNSLSDIAHTNCHRFTSNRCTQERCTEEDEFWRLRVEDIRLVFFQTLCAVLVFLRLSCFGWHKCVSNAIVFSLDQVL